MTPNDIRGLLLTFAFSERIRMGRVIGDGPVEGGESGEAACGDENSRPLLADLLMRGSCRGVDGKADRSRGVSSIGPYVGEDVRLQSAVIDSSNSA
jgi:hypothetical protein